MADVETARDFGDPASDRDLPPTDGVVIGSDDYANITGESLGATLDLDSWQTGVRALQTFERLEREIAEAERLSGDLRRAIRDRIFDMIDAPSAPPGAGVYRATIDEVRTAQSDVLF